MIFRWCRAGGAGDERCLCVEGRAVGLRRERKEGEDMKTAIAACIVLTCLATVRSQTGDAITCKEKCSFEQFRPLIISHALQGSAIRQVEPEYPAAARYVQVSGKVRLALLVDRSGEVIDTCT